MSAAMIWPTTPHLSDGGSVFRFIQETTPGRESTALIFHALTHGHKYK